jgi:hypothetical protein
MSVQNAFGAMRSVRSFAIIALAAAALAAPVFPAEAAAPAASAGAWAALPDWSGDWVVVPGARGTPPYKPDWAAKHRQAGAAIAKGALRDPLKTCGIPAGMPRMMILPDSHEWIVSPHGVWHAVENGSTVRRIYTDGRPHLSGDDIFPTYTGDNVGRWEGDTLVVDTIGLRDDTWLDDRGTLHSDQLHVVQRIRKLPSGRLEAQVTLNDPVAFTAPWRMTIQYRRLPAGSYIRDYACKVLRASP